MKRCFRAYRICTGYDCLPHVYRFRGMCAFRRANVGLLPRIPPLSTGKHYMYEIERGNDLLYLVFFAAQEIYAACVMIWNVLPPSRPPTVFRFSADQINVFLFAALFSALAVRRQCIAVLSFWTMRRRSPACHNCYRFVFRLTGYSGARPRRHRLQAYRTRRAVAAAEAGVRKQCSSFRAARILSSSLEAFCSLCLMQLREQITLHVVHHARLAKSPPRCPWLKRFCTLPVRPHAAIWVCLR